MSFKSTTKEGRSPVRSSHSSVAQSTEFELEWIGKAGPTLNGANFGYGGQEIASDSYRVLLNA